MCVGLSAWVAISCQHLNVEQRTPATKFNKFHEHEMRRFVAVQVRPTDSEDDAAVQSFVNHYRTAEVYCAYELVHRSLSASSVLPAIFSTTLFAAACFLLSRHLQVSTE